MKALELKGKKIVNTYTEKFSQSKRDIAQVENLKDYKEKLQTVIGGNLIEIGEAMVDNVEYDYAVLKVYFEKID